MQIKLENNEYRIYDRGIVVEIADLDKLSDTKSDSDSINIQRVKDKLTADKIEITEKNLNGLEA